MPPDQVRRRLLKSGMTGLGTTLQNDLMQAFRAAILRFADDQSALYEQDGLLVVGPGPQGRQLVLAVGDYHSLAPSYPDLEIEHLPGRIIAPGFIDLHIHFPQTDVIGSPAAGLL